MRMRFTKMQGLGNDFVVIDAIRQQVDLSGAQIRQLADRHFGIGCDQVLLVEPPRSDDTTFHYRIFNADGSEVEQCGNGARCFARYVRDEGLTSANSIRVGTAAGPITLELCPDGQVSVDMGLPRFDPAAIPLAVRARAPAYDLGAGCRALRIGALSMGNPHAVLAVTDDLDQAPVSEIGPRIERDPLFPRGANVGFMQRQSATAIRLRVWERGVGETLACGTGACAAVVVGRLWGELDERVEVSLPGGTLIIDWPGEGMPVRMTGPAVRVFDGSIEMERLRWKY
ncbi:diaminopimelate epimerase [Lamprobacter modestohalophilus]|uniref:diaminopimelate epimerase n=1 Tax=Lamprobacter modestohalophilus TaxID=1064514 RepID=UPI002ADEEF29|nr:diaminopimelate epimerase [Lamprobacter modestohalophilus]MEA1048679.1 diaminopimelate epimerase [Lamprobacter modestohalophilus]